MKIAVLTLGCKVNQAESASIKEVLKLGGHELVELEDSPELCIINTCTVTQKSDYQSRQLIRRAAKTGAELIVTGCYSELNKEEVKKIANIKEIIENKEKVNYFNKFIKETESFYLNIGSGGRARYTLKVQDGCDANCSYCAIPMARGRSRSVLLEEIILSIRGAVERGYNEVVLTGIHLGQYRTEKGGSLSTLIEDIFQRTDIKRIRLSSLEINEIDDKLIGLFSEGRLCPHLHIPLQSGDDEILRAMNRRYSAQEFSERIVRITSRLQDVALGTDVIVGFPGEGERNFQNTFEVLERLPFTYIHVFPFSPRLGTKAFMMKGRPNPMEVKKRASLLRALSLRKKSQYMARHIGKTLEILIEERVSDSVCRGTSGNYLKVEVSGKGLSVGSLVYAKISGVRGEVLCGFAEHL